MELVASSKHPMGDSMTGGSGSKLARDNTWFSSTCQLEGNLSTSGD
jgi:hypothetical protein